MFSLAHFSDLHLNHVPGSGRFNEYFGKRLIGRLSWQFRRRHIHVPGVAEAVLADIAAHQPDHIAFTGDLVNMALAAEFPRAAEFLAAIAPADRLTFVPGNHDAYVHVPWDRGAGLWAPYMTGDMRLTGAAGGEVSFPFVRQRRNVALIGLSTASPQSLRKAGGTLGARQLEDLARTLGLLGERGYFRIVLIHHPPLPGQAKPRKALTDAGALREVLLRQGAELVLHGHNHRRSSVLLGATRIDGAPSASASGELRSEAAGWTLYRVSRRGAAWQVETVSRSWNPALRAMQTVLESPALAG